MQKLWQPNGDKLLKMDMKKVIKRSIGFLIICNLVPLIFILITIAEGSISEYGYLVPYVAGWAGNIIVIAIIGFVKLMEWFFD